MNWLLLAAALLTPTGDLEAETRRAHTPTKRLSYDQARRHLFATVDTRLLYSGDLVADARGPTNTEHVWPQSRFGRAKAAKSDLHHLFPTYAAANSSRGNLPFAEIPDAETRKWWKGPRPEAAAPPPRDRDEYSEWATGRFEPREASKGNVARALFYVRVVYGDQGIDLPWFEKQVPTLLKWHAADPADEAEKARNKRVRVLQGNTNPFIDDAALAARLFTPPTTPASRGR